MLIAYVVAPEKHRLTVLVVVPDLSPPEDILYLDVVETTGPDARTVTRTVLDLWSTTCGQSSRATSRWRARLVPGISYAKAVVDGLEPGTEYRIAVMRRQESLTKCFGTTLPGSETESVRLVFGSCHGVSSDRVKAGHRASFLGSAHGRLRAATRAPVYQLWLGDQVYVDDPWRYGWRPSVDARREIVSRYRVALGLTAHPSGLPTILSMGSNHFIPGDHEFWYNYPQASLGHLPGHTVLRVARQLKRYFFNRSEAPHPFFQGIWGRTAGAAFMAFQSADPRSFDMFDPSVSPSALQVIEVSKASVVIVDTHWHRTMSVRDATGRARFLRQDDFDRLAEIMTREHLIVLALAKPLVGFLPPNGLFADSQEIGPEAYRNQYCELWRVLSRRAERQRPTVVLAGDVHHHTARVALDGRLAEFVCSPMALIDSLDYLEVLPIEISSSSDMTGHRKWDDGEADTKSSHRSVSFNVKSHSGFSRFVSRVKRARVVAGRLANNAQAAILGQDQKPLRYRDSARRYPLIGGDGRVTYADGSQLFPPVSAHHQVVPKVECSGLGALDLDLDGEHPVIRYRAELDNSGISDVVPGRVDITLRWTGTRWVD